MNSDELFWLDPWSAQGQEVSAKLLPQAHDLRLHAERAIVLLAEARRQSRTREPEALTAMDLGARRLDFIGLKFQLAQEIASDYAQAFAQQHDKTHRSATNICSGDQRRQWPLPGPPRRLFGAEDRVQPGWLGENRPYWLNNVTVRYDLEIEQWQRRGNQFEAAIRGWHNGQDLPAARPSGCQSLPRARTERGRMDSAVLPAIAMPPAAEPNRLPAKIFLLTAARKMHTRCMFERTSQKALPLVLLIDDDLVSREVTATVLTMNGYTVHTAENGAAALEMLAAEGAGPA